MTDQEFRPSAKLKELIQNKYNADLRLNGYMELMKSHYSAIKTLTNEDFKPSLSATACWYN